MAKAFRISFENFKRWLTNPRIYVLFVLIYLMQDSMMIGSVRRFARDMNIPVAPWIYPFLPSDWYICMLEALGAVFLFCDVPVINKGTPYVFIRSGQRAWINGQILYIITAAFLYQFVFMLTGILLLAPRLELTLNWGKTLGTLAQTNMGYEKHGIGLSGAIVRQLTPIRAMFLSFGIRWMVTTLLGMFLLCINLFLPRICGTILGGLVALLHPLAINFSGTILFFLSPSSWTALQYVNIGGAQELGSVSIFPSLSYIWAVGIGAITILVVICKWGFRKRSIYTLSTL